MKFLIPELTITFGILAAIILAVLKNLQPKVIIVFGVLVLVLAIVATVNIFFIERSLFFDSVATGSFPAFFKVLIGAGGVLALLLSLNNSTAFENAGELVALILAVVLGGNMLVMSNNLLITFLAIELVSLSSYLLAGFAFTKPGAEASLKYFLFGAAVSATMLYGFSLLFGITGTLNFADNEFANQLHLQDTAILLLAGSLALGGFLFKISAAPMHLWAPDVYDAAPLPVVAFFSTVPKLAGLAAFVRFLLAINVFGQTAVDWQMIIAGIALFTMVAGNFAALLQDSPRRMMAYSSIAQAGFLLIGLVTLLPQGLYFLLFYAAVYLIMNFAVFSFLSGFEKNGLYRMASYGGRGRIAPAASIALLIGLIALTGLPPTAGFTAKFFVFSSLWQAYEISGKSILLWLLVAGLLATVVSLFFYLKIPYNSFLKDTQSAEKQNFITPENLLGSILVLLLLGLFFAPNLLMGWINKVTFVF